MFKFIKNYFSPKEVPQILPKQWRVGMWVVVDSRVGIIFKLGEPTEVHYVSVETGETTLVEKVPLNALRQAKWLEIPACRRNITLEKAQELGYGS